MKSFIGYQFGKCNSNVPDIHHYLFYIYDCRYYKYGDKIYQDNKHIFTIEMQAHKQKEDDTYRHDTLLYSYSPRINDLVLSLYDDCLKKVNKMLNKLITCRDSRDIVKTLNKLKAKRIKYSNKYSMFIPFRVNEDLYKMSLDNGYELKKG